MYVPLDEDLWSSHWCPHPRLYVLFDQQGLVKAKARTQENEQQGYSMVYSSCNQQDNKKATRLVVTAELTSKNSKTLTTQRIGGK